jgi:long-subunit fatty acid transport protein
VGVGSYFGLGLNYSNDWAGRYYAQRVSFTTAAVNPTIGYRIARWLSIGGGASVVSGNLSARVAVNTLAEPGAAPCCADLPGDQAVYAISVCRLIVLRSGLLRTAPRGAALAFG